jgi:hypothetical protein
MVHANVDGHELVAGFSIAAADPVATWAVIRDQVASLNVVTQIKSVKTKIMAQRQLAADQWGLAEIEEKANGQSKQYQVYITAHNSAMSQVALLEEELGPLNETFEKERSRLYEENIVYSPPGSNESQISDADFLRLSGLFTGLTEHQRLTVSGEIIPYYVGAAYWLKSGSAWTKTTIAVAGEDLPKGAILEEKLTEAQRIEIGAQLEAARVAGLSAEAKAAEMAGVLNAAAQDAAQKKSVADITGDTFDAKAWYAEKKAEIELKYAS